MSIILHRSLAAFAVVVLVACTKDEGPFLAPVTPAAEGVDTVRFSTQVVPIFQQHCWVCHPPMGNLDLSNAVAHAQLVNATSSGYAPAMRVVPGDPMASVLWHKVAASGTYGVSMPANGTFLSTAELQVIRTWIEQGALDN